MIKILYEDNHLLVVVKPANIPVQEDESKDEDLLTILKKYIKEKYNKPGNVYIGLVHRLDRPVSGIMVFAKTSKAASRLSDQIRLHKIEKRYYAVVNGNILEKSGILKDKIIKDTKTNISRISKDGKESILNYKLIECKDNMALVDIELITGRPHQIRVQFSSRNHPLYGDQKYNKEAKVGQQIALFSYYLSFYHPITNEKMEFIETCPDRYPFNIFKNTL